MDTVVLAAAGIRVTCVLAAAARSQAFTTATGTGSGSSRWADRWTARCRPGCRSRTATCAAGTRWFRRSSRAAIPAPGQPDLELPDHGELSALSWPVTQRDDRSLTLIVLGRGLPYRLERQATVAPAP
jgi:hypothetical protein